jgi:hypothetical protein
MTFSRRAVQKIPKYEARSSNAKFKLHCDMLLQTRAIILAAIFFANLSLPSRTALKMEN